MTRGNANRKVWGTIRGYPYLLIGVHRVANYYRGYETAVGSPLQGLAIANGEPPKGRLLGGAGLRILQAQAAGGAPGVSLGRSRPPVLQPVVPPSGQVWGIGIITAGPLRRHDRVPNTRCRRQVGAAACVELGEGI